MKISPSLLAAAAWIGSCALPLLAQDPSGGPQGGPPPGGPRGGPGGPRHRHPPLVAALDVNKDGKIDASEIANAPAALATLDRNQDGQLTAEELRPSRPAGGPGGPDGQGGPGGPGAPGVPGGPGGPGGPRGARQPGDHPGFVSPLLAALDSNHDGILSADEIANAPVALKTLDKNADGELTPEEFQGRPPGAGRPGFGDGPRPRPPGQ